MKKNVLIIGSGGREHALAWKMAQSKKVGELFIAPGNPGTALIGSNVAIPADDISALVAFAKENHIDLTVVGPDDALAAGIVDAFQKEGLAIFGPTQKAAQIESSKVFAKELMERYGLPTARSQHFTEIKKATAYIRTQPVLVVIKASGLALGKGVFICQTHEEAERALRSLLVDGALGEAGTEVVIEEFLEGKEISAHAISDGTHHLSFPFAQDHKRIGEGNTGPNTGGMGTYAPVMWATPENTATVEKITGSTIKALQAEVDGFQGCLFPGLMLTSSGPKLLEFNGRFGDPETQSYMRLMKTDLYDLLEATVQGRLNTMNLEWEPGFAVCVILASEGYPGTYEKGRAIKGMAEAENIPGVVVFHAGTQSKDGSLVTSGGRVLGVTATGTTLQEAVDTAYRAVGMIDFPGMQFRKDIARSGL
ncbi:MAG: phosphoribosylamine--glycine ligase [bacterium]